MGTISLGKVALTWRGEYDAALTYARQDVVHFDGTAFICLIDDTNDVEPSTGVPFWQVFAAGVPTTNLAPAGTLYYVDAGGELAPLTADAADAGKLLVFGDDGLPSWQVSSNRPALRVKRLEKTPSRMSHHRVIMENGDVRAWGLGSSYQLGQGDTTTTRQIPATVALPPGAPDIVETFSDSSNNSWAIDSEGDLWGWGVNRNGSLGLGDTTFRGVPVCLTKFDDSQNSLFGKKAVKVAIKNTPNTTSNSTLVLCDDGTVHAAGANSDSQLGDGTTTARSFFSQLAIVSDIIDIQGSDERLTAYFALKSNGEVFSWGRGAQNVLGHGSTANTTIPTKIMALDNINIVKMSVGSVHAGYIDDENNLYMVGTNTTYGNLGLGDLTNRLVPEFVSPDVAEVYARGNGVNTRTFIIKTDGTLQAAGSGSEFASGINDTAAHSSNFINCLKTLDGGATTLVMDNIVEIQQQSNTVVARDADGILWGVGYSGTGALGYGGIAATTAFFREVLLHRHNVDSYAVQGNATTVALHILTEDGQLYISGSSSSNMNTDIANRFVPAPVVF